MRKKILFATNIIMLILCACAKENQTADDDVPHEDKNNESDADTSYYCLYDDFIEKIRNGMDNPDSFLENEEWVSTPLWYAISSKNKTLGYLQEDIDCDGIDELLIGYDDSAENVSDGMLLYIYTIRDGNLYPVIESGEREWYQLCENNVIKFEYAYPNNSYGDEYIKYKYGNLELIESAYGIAEIEERRNRYYYTDNPSREDNTREITEEDFCKLLDDFDQKYKAKNLQLHHFIE